jgi:signal transduction histidine kinase
VVAPLVYAAQAALFLIGREAINNAVNHARAGSISVLFVYQEKEVRMTVQDDGVGFDVAATGRKTEHFGVRSMAERAKQIGAAFRIETAPGRGATIEVVVARKKLAE